MDGTTSVGFPDRDPVRASNTAAGESFRALRDLPRVVVRSQLLVVVGGTLAGLAFVMGLLGVVYEPFLLFVSIPFLVAAYVIWFHGTGRLEFRRRMRATDPESRDPFRGAAGGRAGNRDGEGPNWSDPEWQRRRRRARRATDGAGSQFGGRRRRSRQRGRTGRSGTVRDTGPTLEEAYEVLDLDPGSSSEEVRAAYRRKVKEVHPDRDGGSEEAFKRVNDAYETLSERAK
jgi:hypothetical protein